MAPEITTADKAPAAKRRGAVIGAAPQLNSAGLWAAAEAAQVRSPGHCRRAVVAWGVHTCHLQSLSLGSDEEALCITKCRIKRHGPCLSTQSTWAVQIICGLVLRPSFGCFLAAAGQAGGAAGRRAQEGQAGSKAPGRHQGLRFAAGRRADAGGDWRRSAAAHDLGRGGCGGGWRRAGSCAGVAGPGLLLPRSRRRRPRGLASGG